MSKALNRVVRGRRIAAKRGKSEMWRRIGAKCEAYLNGHRLATELGLAAETCENACHCERSSHLHLHVFGSVISITHAPTVHDAARLVAASHTFRKMGCDHTWDKNTAPRDHKTRAYLKYRAAVKRATALADKRANARKLLLFGNYKAQVNACETLGLDPNVHAKRKQLVCKGRKRPPIQVFRCSK